MKTSETKFESYDAKGTREYNSWESTFRSEPPKIKPHFCGGLFLHDEDGSEPTGSERLVDENE